MQIVPNHGRPSKQSAAVQRVLDALDAVVPTSAGWMARCPGHDDHSPSLSIREGDDGRVLLYCFAGCDTADIIDYLGLTWGDMFPRRGERRR